MIIVRLKGGLGNQMFQYALGRALSLKNNDNLRLDVDFYKSKNQKVKRVYNLDVFNIQAEIAIGLWKNLFFKLTKYLKEKSFYFNQDVLSLCHSVYLDGYWQSPKYFERYEEVIRNDFTLKSEPDSNIKSMAEEISSSNSLCIHVRRTDYVGNNYHDVIDQEYYKKGVEYITQKSKIDKIYIFSDDTEWCENNLSFEIPTIFVGIKYVGLKDEGHMYLMSLCKHFIIANSSFSWWAVWLSNHKNKIVVAPKKWFTDESIDTKDLIPKEWTRI